MLMGLGFFWLCWVEMLMELMVGLGFGIAHTTWPSRVSPNVPVCGFEPCLVEWSGVSGWLVM